MKRRIVKETYKDGTIKEAQDYCTFHYNPIISKETIKV